MVSNPRTKLDHQFLGLHIHLQPVNHSRPPRADDDAIVAVRNQTP